jgi:hypothetical protein
MTVHSEFENRTGGNGNHSNGENSRDNRLLADLPLDEQAIIEPLLEDVVVESREMFAEAGTSLDWVHFPSTAVISLVTVVSDGGLEAMTVGRDGMTGISLLSGSKTTFQRVIGQIPGDAKRIASHEFSRVLPHMPELQRRVLLYSQLAFDASSQSAACNRLHITEERCARWLLMSQDRVGGDELDLTQTFLAQMLGVRRPAVTVAVGILEKAGLIAHRRARIRIIDRAGLEEAACECYHLIRDRTEVLLGSN